MGLLYHVRPVLGRGKPDKCTGEGSNFIAYYISCHSQFHRTMIKKSLYVTARSRSIVCDEGIQVAGMESDATTFKQFLKISQFTIDKNIRSDIM